MLYIFISGNKLVFYTDNHEHQDFAVQVWTGHEGVGKMRLPDFKTIGT
jgi:hypothetical protein